MYTSYFGLEEKPFSIAPNPDYLFMSDRHREALNHLTYGLGDTGGFVLLTGEVGTGKTTISRCLMDNLPENTQAAFILNPTLSSQELLATICDELKIRYRKTGATLKTLTDKIQQKLLKNHSENINTLLIVDEAQHLQPEVLEQLRLLTNLETNTKKLLQVILIGQPELQQLLQRRDLRQLAQRITARYHLLPLNKQEVEQYLKHRLSVAKCFRNIFDKSAVSAIHKTCKGIPRLMNLLAERSLINAYNSNNATVNRKMVLQAAYDALGDEFEVTPWWQKPVIKWFSLSLAFILVLSVGIWWGTQGLSLNDRQITNQISLMNEPAKSQNKASLNSNDFKENSVAIDTQTHEEDQKIKQHVAVEQKENTVQTQTPQSLDEETIKTVASNHVDSTTEPQVMDPVEPKIKTPVKSLDDLEVKPTDDVSDELLARFQSAIEETQSSDHRELNESIQTNVDVKSISQMPPWVQNGIPALQFEMHLYASDGQGWVRVNGRDRYEGDYIGRELLLNEIHPQHVVLSFRGEKFKMNALSSWN